MGVGYGLRRRMWLIGFRCIRWVSQARTRPTRGGSPRWCRRRLLPRAPRGGLAVMPPDAQPLPPPVGVGQQLSREVPAPVPRLLPPETHPRPRLAAGRQPHRWKTRPPRADVARPCPASRGPRTPAQAQPHLRCRHHPRAVPSHRNGDPRGPAPEAAPPAGRVASRPRLSPPPPTAARCDPARVCAHDRIPPVATPPLRAPHGWRFNVAADTRSGTLTRR